jgi:hypothetical protein
MHIKIKALPWSNNYSIYIFLFTQGQMFWLKAKGHQNVAIMDHNLNKTKIQKV